MLFFRELPDPLIDSNLREELEKCVNVKNSQEETVQLIRSTTFVLKLNGIHLYIFIYFAEKCCKKNCLQFGISPLNT